MFYSLLEGLRTSLQDYHKTSCVILYLVEFSIMLKLFSNLFWKSLPIKRRLVGRPCLVCIIENLFKHVHEMGGREYELYTWFSLCFQLVSQLIFFCILIFMFSYICILQTSNSINFDCYLLFHTYIYDLIMLTYLHILKHKLYFC